MLIKSVSWELLWAVLPLPVLWQRSPTVVAGVSLIGSPEPVAFATDQVAQLPAALQAKLPAELIEQTYQQLAKFDLSEHPEALAGRPMFFFNGTADQMVPYQYIRDFSTVLKMSQP